MRGLARGLARGLVRGLARRLACQGPCQGPCLVRALPGALPGALPRAVGGDGKGLVSDWGVGGGRQGWTGGHRDEEAMRARGGGRMVHDGGRG